MVVLDTSEVSGSMHLAPNPMVALWVAELATSSPSPTVVAEAELCFVDCFGTPYNALFSIPLMESR